MACLQSQFLSWTMTVHLEFIDHTIVCLKFVGNIVEKTVWNSVWQEGNSYMLVIDQPWYDDDDDDADDDEIMIMKIYMTMMMMILMRTRMMMMMNWWWWWPWWMMIITKMILIKMMLVMQNFTMIMMPIKWKHRTQYTRISPVSNWNFLRQSSTHNIILAIIHNQLCMQFTSYSILTT